MRAAEAARATAIQRWKLNRAGLELETGIQSDSPSSSRAGVNTAKLINK